GGGRRLAVAPGAVAAAGEALARPGAAAVVGQRDAGAAQAAGGTVRRPARAGAAGAGPHPRQARPARQLDAAAGPEGAAPGGLRGLLAPGYPRLAAGPPPG